MQWMSDWNCDTIGNLLNSSTREQTLIMGCLSVNNFHLSLFACSEEPIHSHFLCQSMHKRILSAFTRGKNHFPNYICTFLITISNNQIECLNRTTSSILWFSDKFLYNRAHISQIFRYLHLNFDPWMVFASLPVDPWVVFFCPSSSWCLPVGGIVFTVVASCEPSPSFFQIGGKYFGGGGKTTAVGEQCGATRQDLQKINRFCIYTLTCGAL